MSGLAAKDTRIESGDLIGLVTLSPSATGWTWTAMPETPEPMDRRDIEAYAATHPVQETLRQAELQAGIVEVRETSRSNVGKKGSSFATLYETADGAHDALASAASSRTGGSPVSSEPRSGTWNGMFLGRR